MRRMVLLALLVAALVATPVVAKPVVSQGEAWSIQLDTENGLVVFFNMGRDAFCAWADSGFAGEPPVTKLLAISESETPTGAIVSSVTGPSSLELWRLDADADFSGPCPDTDDSSEPWAVGTASDRSHDNDLAHDDSVDVYGLSRTDAFGETANGRVVDATGDSLAVLVDC